MLSFSYDSRIVYGSYYYIYFLGLVFVNNDNIWNIEYMNRLLLSVMDYLRSISFENCCYLFICNWLFI